MNNASAVRATSTCKLKTLNDLCQKVSSIRPKTKAIAVLAQRWSRFRSARRTVGALAIQHFINIRNAAA